MPGADLPGGRYPLSASLQAFLGAGGAAAQASSPIRTNLEWPVYSGALADTTASLATGVMTVVPVPVDVGMAVTNISVIVGAGQVGASITHQWAALYSGTTVTSPPLIAQTADGLATAIPASARLDFAFATPQLITPAQAPYGFVYAAIAVTATTVPSLITTPCGAAAASAFRWFTNAVKYFGQTSGSAVGATAPATLINASTTTTAPVCLLW